jgi:hypothetical protein
MGHLAYLYHIIQNTTMMVKNVDSLDDDAAVIQKRASQILK